MLYKDMRKEMIRIDKQVSQYQVEMELYEKYEIKLF